MSNQLALVEQREIIKRALMPENSNDHELELFLAYASRTGLDPIARQIYATRNNGKLMISATIDGFRVVAERSGRYRGQVGPQWCGPDGVWRDVWLASQPPAAARVGVLRSDFTEPMWAIALWSEYVQKTREGKPSFAWARMPSLMLAKCAEALALRKAFPNDLSGIYASEEIGSETPAAVELPAIEVQAEAEEFVTSKQVQALAIALKSAGFSSDEEGKATGRSFIAYLAGRGPLASVKELTKAEAQRVLDRLGTGENGNYRAQEELVDEALAAWSASKMESESGLEVIDAA